MSVIRRWLHALNPFKTAAKKSDENGMRQIVFHDAVLAARVAAFSADTDYPIWYSRFHPLATDAAAKYAAYYGAQSAQEGQTTTLDIRIANIQGQTGKAHDWFNRTAAVYAVSNPGRFTAIWANGLKPFSGKKDNIVAALKTLSLNIGADTNTSIAAIKSEVDAEYTIIKPLRDAQLLSIGSTGISSAQLNTAIKAALTMQWRNQGLEINKFADDPDSENIIKSFHDLEAIQQHSQKVFNLTLNNPETRDVAQRTMVFNSRLRSKATGGDVKIYLASTPGGTDSTPVLITDGHDIHFTAADFGITNYGVNRHITAITATGTTISFMLQLY